MKVKRIMEQANKAKEMVERAEQLLMQQARYLATKADIMSNEWNYKPKEGKFYCWLRCFDFMGCDFPEFKYRTLEVNYHGLHIRMGIDREYYKNEFYAYIIEADVERGSDVAALVKKLHDRRKQLMSNLLTSIGEDVTKYLIENEKAVCEYPGQHRYETGGLTTRTHIVWACGGNSEENQMLHRPENVVVQELIQRKFCYCTTESLKNEEEFYPCVFEDDTMTEKTFHLTDYVDLVISRQRQYHDDVMFSPALYAQFVIRKGWSSISPAYIAAIEAAELYTEREKQNRFKSFCKDMDNAEWVAEGEKAVACIPIIYEEYAEYILKTAQATYPEDMFSFELIDGICPVFNNCLSDNETSKLIRVSISM